LSIGTSRGQGGDQHAQQQWKILSHEMDSSGQGLGRGLRAGCIPRPHSTLRGLFEEIGNLGEAASKKPTGFLEKWVKFVD
jgi:hypothetical protein